MFAVCACARFQVTPKTSHLLAIKRIFRYLKGKPTLGLWYSRDSPFDLVAYTDSDYAGATQDRKCTTGGCQFLGNRLISWQCKKQTVVATSTTKAEYVAAASCCGQVLWIQNQLLDYGYNFINTVINIDNNNLLTKGFDAGRFQYLVSNAQTRFETTSKQSNDPPLSRVNTLGSGDDSMKLMELMAHCIKLSELFWGTTTARTTDDGEVEITASIDGQVNTITEASLRRYLKLEDSDGAATIDIGLEEGQGSGTMHKTPNRPYDSPLSRVHTLESDKGSLQQNELMDLVTNMTDRVKVLENDMQQTKKEQEDSSKQGMKISKINKDPTISLVQPKQGMEYDFNVSTAKGFTTASIPITTASATPKVSTVAANLVYIRRSAEKRKNKGKAIMKEDEYVQKKTKKQLEQERIMHQEAIRLQE
ncbi:hypothetical protein Tco_0307162 [Tanacetum coccineum]